jgi:hypothetical protein
VGFYDTPGYAYGIALSGDYIYVADEHTGLQIYEYLVPDIKVLDGDGEKVLKVSKNLFMDKTEINLSGVKFPTKLNVYDITGRIREKAPIYNSFPVSIGDDLPPGIYFIRVKGFKPVKVMKLK